MRAAPRLTIGLPVYNGENYLAESLEALLGQSYEDFELVISDNASTDGTADICHRYGKQDSRIRYIRQPRNIGLQPNHNFVITQARGELFKMASHDDLYARDLLKRCVDALDEHPEVVIAHCWEAMIDTSGNVTKLLQYSVAADSPRAPERFRSMLFDGWDDYTYGVIADGGPPPDAPASAAITSQTGPSTPSSACKGRSIWSRTGCTSAGTIPNGPAPIPCAPGARTWTRAGRTGCGTPLCVCTASTSGAMSRPSGTRRCPAADRKECYRYLARWLASRALPVAGRSLSGGALRSGGPTAAPDHAISVNALVAGQERKGS